MFAGALAVFASLLISTGIAKVRRPGSTVTALRSVGVGATPAAARALGVFEVATGSAVLVGLRWAIPLVVVLYAGFIGFLIVALRAGAPSCGCAGAPDTPPTPAHLVVNLGGVLAGGWVLFLSSPLLRWTWDVDSLLIGGSVAMATWLAHACITDLPRSLAAT